MLRSYTNEFKYNLRNKLDISEIIDIFTSEDMENTPLESRMQNFSVPKAQMCCLGTLTLFLFLFYSFLLKGDTLKCCDNNTKDYLCMPLRMQWMCKFDCASDVRAAT